MIGDWRGGVGVGCLTVSGAVGSEVTIRLFFRTCARATDGEELKRPSELLRFRFLLEGLEFWVDDTVKTEGDREDLAGSEDR